jgi:ribonuclease HII
MVSEDNLPSVRLRNRFTPGSLLEAGCDEAGRGCLAGPVVASAVILPPRFRHPFLADSKTLTAAQREEARDHITQHALAWAVAEVDARGIDRLNILRASIRAMHLAIADLHLTPELLLVDGNYFIRYRGVPHHCIVSGDARYKSIAAASILAKTHRDHLMADLAERYPHYGWDTNKGYPTEDHRAALREFGPTDYHRRSFQLLPVQQLSAF